MTDEGATGNGHRQRLQTLEAAIATSTDLNQDADGQGHMSVVIRRGVENDAAALAELAARTFRETFAADNRPEDIALHLSRSFGISQQRTELLDHRITTLLVEVDAQLAGYAQLRRSVVPDCVTGEVPIELWRFYIAQPWQGRGVAQALMRRVEAEAHRQGARTIWLGVWERNARALAFYQKNHFVDVGSHVFTVGEDAQTDRILVRSMPATMASGAAERGVEAGGGPEQFG